MQTTAERLERYFSPPPSPLCAEIPCKIEDFVAVCTDAPRINQGELHD